MVIPLVIAGFTATAGGGTNVDAPFVELQLGRRFERAAFFELFADYSYDAAVSEFSFQTFGLGARTYLFAFDRFELFHQAVAALAVSSSGGHDNRDFGQRLLGAVLTQGVGLQAQVVPRWQVALTLSTGTPVWLRPELTVRYAF
jgi:hypothetical protein